MLVLVLEEENKARRSGLATVTAGVQLVSSRGSGSITSATGKGLASVVAAVAAAAVDEDADVDSTAL